ncbi:MULTISPECIES: CDP-alcohol phosphatidyltransferase family protein [Citricoccus]|uniref:CDP-alcohol phosphatidyltransferase family protein n=1 Tax=Citricoccus muralis TaxID=169134 RepID=A0ABY8HAC0_9MICC|nr:MULTISPECIES: CDP-alcohol phosphatidyltransferase family protein [Citricoccus]WBL18743.1 CDP-alcohol phosphatidyltransferase family protein [Citricoccus sp. NR2]WFP17577.1 CDP-alcohol phosphatidyltransferase family protein [Citricoccus muralis]
MKLIGAGTRTDIDYRVSDRWLTAPNIITLVRFCLVPLFVWQTFTGQYLGAFITLAVLFSTDWVDGYVARRFNQISTVGKWLDPLADRISIVVVAITVVITGVAPSWLVLTLLIPDLLLFVLNAVLFLGSPELEVTALGKIRTAMLMAGIPFLLLAQVADMDSTFWHVVAYVFLIPGCLGHWGAAIDYTLRSLRKHRELRAAGINPRERQAWTFKHQQGRPENSIAAETGAS